MNEQAACFVVAISYPVAGISESVGSRQAASRIIASRRRILESFSSGTPMTRARRRQMPSSVGVNIKKALGVYRSLHDDSRAPPFGERCRRNNCRAPSRGRKRARRRSFGRALAVKSTFVSRATYMASASAQNGYASLFARSRAPIAAGAFLARAFATRRSSFGAAAHARALDVININGGSQK